MEFVVSRSELSYSEDPSKVELTEDPMEEPKEVLEGSPVISSEMLSVSVSEGGFVVARGVMECTPGKYKDVVDDEEFFTVIHGRATVEIMNNSGDDNCLLELTEGCVGELRRGSEIEVTVHETLLKTFQLTMVVDDEEGGNREGMVKAEQEFAERSYCKLSSDIPLQHEEMVEGESWTNGEPPPDITSTILSTIDDGSMMRGLWRCTKGSCTYVEQDELFTVLDGHATVTVKKPNSDNPESERVIQLSKGMIGEFKQGDVATFVIESETPFLKTFQITAVKTVQTNEAKKKEIK